MSPNTFEHLLSLVGPLITKKETAMRQPISAAERLTLTIHYLAYGDSQQSVSFSYRIAKSTVSTIIRDTCNAIWEALQGTYLKAPKSQAEWKEIAKQFMDVWNFPHTVGAIDGKHVAIKCPLNSGSQYYNYKGFFSLVLLAICDAHYCFTLVDIGDYGSNNDSGIFSNSEMGKLFQNGKMHLPQPDCLEDSAIQSALPYFLVGDEAFPLRPWLQWPYPGKEIPEDKVIFNYRLSRARRVIENAFGILVARWRIFLTCIQTSVTSAESIIQATICLHNYLRQTNSAAYCPSGFVDSEDSTGEIKPGEWRNIVSAGRGDGALRPLPCMRGSRLLKSAVEVREVLKNYVNSNEGCVPWQWDYVRSRGPRK